MICVRASELLASSELYPCKLIPFFKKENKELTKMIVVVSHNDDKSY